MSSTQTTTTTSSGSGRGFRTKLQRQSQPPRQVAACCQRLRRAQSFVGEIGRSPSKDQNQVSLSFSTRLIIPSPLPRLGFAFLKGPAPERVAHEGRAVLCVCESVYVLPASFPYRPPAHGRHGPAGPGAGVLPVYLSVRRERRERERTLLGTTVHNGGSRAAPAARTPHHHA